MIAPRSHVPIATVVWLVVALMAGLLASLGFGSEAVDRRYFDAVAFQAATDRVAELYRAWGRPDAAEEWAERVAVASPSSS